MFGNIAIFGWPLVVLILLRTRPLAQAVTIAVVAGYLFLPLKFGLNLPLLPRLDKDSIPALAVLVIWALGLVAVNQARSAQARAARRGQIAQHALPSASAYLEGWLPKSKLTLILIAALLIGPIMTALTNTEPLVYGARNLPPLRLFDAFSEIQALIIMLIPLLLGRKFLASPEAHRALLGVFCVLGVFYGFLALYEARMSPQLNRMVYGFFAHDWRQHVRDGGFRPVAFLSHALLLALFLSTALIASIGWLRGMIRPKPVFFIMPVILGVALVATQSLGALLIAVLIVPMAVLFRPRGQLLFATAIAVIILTYPMLRGAGLVPVDRVVSVASQIDANRASSLQFRMENEDRLLAKAAQKPLFGWGGWGRNRVFDERGRDISTTDGYWAITIGLGGWVRYLALFGLLTLPIFSLFRRRKQFDIDAPTAILCLIMAANLIDMIPNSSLTPLSWLVTGALLGRAELGALRASPEAAPSRRAGRTSAPGQEALASTAETEQISANPYSRPYSRQTRRHTRHSAQHTPRSPAR